MAQYKILARKPLGPSETGPKQTLEVKTVSQHRLGVAARRPHDGAPPSAQRAAQGCMLRAPPRATHAHGGGHLRAQRAQVGGRRRVTPCATIAHGGRPAGAKLVGQCAAAARSYSVHRSACCVQLQCVSGTLLESRRLSTTNFTGKLSLQQLAVVVLQIRSTTGNTTPSSVCTRRADEFTMNGISSLRWSEQVQPWRRRPMGGSATGGASGMRSRSVGEGGIGG
ncbi:hypothetical protein F511_23643 [Dorcoceras hygrometricum]|uniref:Uncharacterized protein n=1 Tax=Dorcoceras hygrometricum TaxID=472368 RepID=A0A2Z7BTP3_9LAMI|nr:hypothetical protein F511_23643 [Dorcoceras hygrometricum]